MDYMRFIKVSVSEKEQSILKDINMSGKMYLANGHFRF